MVHGRVSRRREKRKYFTGSLLEQIWDIALTFVNVALLTVLSLLTALMASLPLFPFVSSFSFDPSFSLVDVDERRKVLQKNNKSEIVLIYPPLVSKKRLEIIRKKLIFVNMSSDLHR